MLLRCLINKLPRSAEPLSFGSSFAAMAGEVRKGLKIKQEIGLIGGIAFVSGTMIGSGIFMSPQFVLGYVGSPGASLVLWAVAGLVAMFAALSYTELGTVIPESGGEFTYILRIYGSCPAFFSALTTVMVLKPCGAAAMAFSIAEYSMAPFYTECPPPQLLVKSVAAATILIVACINVLNVRVAVRVQVVFLVAKVLALAVIVVGSTVAIIQDSSLIVENLGTHNAFRGSDLSISSMGMAFYQALWSYAGWYNLNYVYEELKRPEVNAFTENTSFSLFLRGHNCHTVLTTWRVELIEPSLSAHVEKATSLTREVKQSGQM